MIGPHFRDLRGVKRQLVSSIALSPVQAIPSTEIEIMASIRVAPWPASRARRWHAIKSSQAPSSRPSLSRDMARTASARAIVRVCFAAGSCSRMTNPSSWFPVSIGS